MPRHQEEARKVPRQIQARRLALPDPPPPASPKYLPMGEDFSRTRLHYESDSVHRPRVRLPPVEEPPWSMPNFLAVLWDAATEIFAGVLTEYMTGQDE
jgi:hypothetical protein